VELPKKVLLYMILGDLVEILIFQDGRGGHFGFCPITKKPGILGRDLGAKFVINGP
jgi:hypothetical protein